MRSLQEPLKEKYGAEFAALFEQMSDLNDRALFSDHPMTEEDRVAARYFRACVLVRLESEVKWYKRMWLKWARCVY